MTEKRLTIQEYMRKAGISQATVYRHIKTGKLKAEKVNGVLHIIIRDDNNENQFDNGLLEQLRKENEYLRQHLGQAMETIQQMQKDSESAKQRSDTIILQLTRELENQQKLLEYHQEPFWKRIFRKGKSESDSGEV
jgi:hypothetical protein